MEENSNALVLQNGTTISDCLQKVEAFCERDASYRSYDLPTEVRRDNKLTEGDIRFANRMVARMGQLVIDSLLSRASAISTALSSIEPAASLADVHIPWLALEQLFTATLGPEVGPARATKILHKKRPALIPILDSVVARYCQAICSGKPTGQTGAAMMVSYMRAIKADVDRNRSVLEAIGLATGLSIVRVFDILLWGYEYEHLGVPPVWLRSQVVEL